MRCMRVVWGPADLVSGDHLTWSCSGPEHIVPFRWFTWFVVIQPFTRLCVHLNPNTPSKGNNLPLPLPLLGLLQSSQSLGVAISYNLQVQQQQGRSPGGSSQVDT